MPSQQPGTPRRKPRFQNREPTFVEIEEATLFMAYVVERYGEHYAPIMDRLVVDLEEARKRGGALRKGQNGSSTKRRQTVGSQP